MKKKYIIICIILFFSGLFFLLYQKELIIFRFSKIQYAGEHSNLSENVKIKKNIKIFYWLNDKWNWEKIDIIWSNNISENIRQIISAFLNLLDEEKIVDKKTSLQSVLLNENKEEIFLSFDRSLFNEESSTYDKLMIIESLLKTIRETELKIKYVKFLVHHQEISDPHLNFLQQWPITGFLT